MAASAKDIVVKPISSKDANRVVKKIHYSGKVVNNSTLHFGVFLAGRLEGAMSFGSPINKKGTIRLVRDTQWYGMLELNRMAFSDALPRNSESRAMAVAFRLIKKHYPHIEWVVSFSDGTQCGDGTIYRAAGFYLTDIRDSDALRINPFNGDVVHVIQAHHQMISKEFRSWAATEGYQLRYIYFINPAAKERLTVPILPFSKIDEMGARMYKGKKLSVSSVDSGTPSDQLGGGGANPTDTLQEVRHD